MDSLSPDEIRYMQEHINDNKQPVFLAASIITLIVAYIAVSLRIFARKRSGVLLGTEDWWILAALVIATGCNTANFFVVHYGIGRHFILVTNRAGLKQSILAAQILYCCAIAPIKFSMLFLYRRIFPSRNYYITFVAVGVFVLSYSFAQALRLIFQCAPVSSYWTGKPGKCLNLNTFFRATAILNSVTDVIIVCLPIPVLWRLKISYTQKVQLIAVFALGGCVCVFGIIRAVQSNNSPWDPTWGNFNVALWSMLELNIAVTSACLPTLRPLFSKRPQRTSGKSASTADVEIFGKSASRRGGDWVQLEKEGGNERPLVH